MSFQASSTGCQRRQLDVRGQTVGLGQFTHDPLRLACSSLVGRVQVQARAVTRHHDAAAEAFASPVVQVERS